MPRGGPDDSCLTASIPLQTPYEASLSPVSDLQTFLKRGETSFGRSTMLNKLFLAAIPLLFVGSAALAEDIVYDGDWRAGETGFIHHRHHCGWHQGYRTVSGVTYYDSDSDNGVAYDTDYAPDYTTYDNGYAPQYTTYGSDYAPGYYGPDYRYDTRYYRDRDWREGRDFDRDRAFRDERFRDRDAGVGARVNVGGREGVGAGARVNDSGVGAGAQVGGREGVGAGAHAGE